MPKGADHDLPAPDGTSDETTALADERERRRHLEEEVVAQSRHFAGVLQGLHAAVADLRVRLAAAEARAVQLEHGTSSGASIVDGDAPAADPWNDEVAASLEEVRRTLAEERARRNAADAEVDLLRTSTSWRITAPVRALTTLLLRRR